MLLEAAVGVVQRMVQLGCYILEGLGCYMIEWPEYTAFEWLRCDIIEAA